MTKEEFIKKIKELGFKNVELKVDEDDDEVFIKHYNDSLKIRCKIWYSGNVTLYFSAAEKELAIVCSVGKDFALFLIKKIENGFNN